MTEEIWREPVRGVIPDASFHSLPGLERIRSFGRFTPLPPIARLFGIRFTEVGVGSLTASMPITPWTVGAYGRAIPDVVLEAALWGAVISGVEAGIEVVPRIVSVNYARPSGLEAGALVARARTIHTRRSLALAEVSVEDAGGRLNAQATGQFSTRPIDPPPPPFDPMPIEEPTYATPDPYLRPAEVRAAVDLSATPSGLEGLRKVMSGALPQPRSWGLTGTRYVDVEEGRTAVAMRATEWLCGSRGRSVAAGALMLPLNYAASSACITLAPPRRIGAQLEFTTYFLRPVEPDGRELLTRGTVVQGEGDLLVSTAEAIDADGNRVAFATMSVMLVEPRTGAGPRPSERALATVLFTDIAGSTGHAERLGDARWTQLLDEHNRIARKEFVTFRGKEVKFTGDGFLATFDSPARAAQCARAIRDGVRRLGVEIYAGLHTGEVEFLSGDVGGIAVNIASRVLDAAAPGEILVTSTVRDLCAGSGLAFEDRGFRALKGVDDEWRLFAVPS